MNSIVSSVVKGLGWIDFSLCFHGGFLNKRWKNIYPVLVELSMFNLRSWVQFVEGEKTNSQFPARDSSREPERQRVPDQKMFHYYQGRQMVLLHLDISECNHAKETTAFPPERELRNTEGLVRSGRPSSRCELMLAPAPPIITATNLRTEQRTLPPESGKLSQIRFLAPFRMIFNFT